MSASSVVVAAAASPVASDSSCQDLAAAASSVHVDAPLDGMTDEERQRFNNRSPTAEEMNMWTSHDNLWSTKATISHRFQNCPPGVVWKILMDNYVASRNSSHAFYLEGSKVRLRTRAPENDRDEVSLRNDYKNSVKEYGFTEEGRSKVVLYPYPGRCNPAMRHIMAAAHVLEALYDADDEEGDVNANVQVSIANGLVDAIDLKENVPSDVLTEFVGRMNLHSTGSGFNPQQLCSRRRALSARWKSHRDDKNITTGTAGGPAGYEAIRKSWLRTLSGDKIFQHDWHFYNKSGIFLNSLTTSGRHAWFMKLLSEGFNNVSRSVPLRAIFLNCHTVDVTLKKHFAESISAKRYELLWQECIKACMPILPCYGTGHHVFCFSQGDAEATVTEIIELIATKMENGKTVAFRRKVPKQSAEVKKAAALAKKAAKKDELDAKKAEKQALAKAKRTAAKDGNVSGAPPNKKMKIADDEHGKTSDAKSVAVEGEAKPDGEANPDGKANSDVKTDADKSIVEEIEQDLRDMTFGEDISDILDLASVEMSARGSPVEDVYPDKVAEVFRQSVYLAWTKLAQYPESCAAVDGQKVSTIGTMSIWSGLKKVIFNEIAWVSRCWAAHHDSAMEKDITSKHAAYLRDLQPVTEYVSKTSE